MQFVHNNQQYYSGYPSQSAPLASLQTPANQPPVLPQLNGQVDLQTYPHQQPIVEYGLEKSKRKQVKNACVNCQKACKKCDDGRPCQRCIKYDLADTCVNSARKERKKGIKRGPYKRK
ncbi:hypothetical protein CLU79DRAFT_706749, partial [Phycomyces nitens]